MPRHQSLEKPLHMKMMRTNNNEQDTDTHKKNPYRSILSAFNVGFYIVISFMVLLVMPAA